MPIHVKNIKKSTTTMERQQIENIGYQIIGCAMEAHSELGGCGLLEAVYEEAFVYELTKAGFTSQRQLDLPIRYKETTLKSPLQIDLLIENKIIVECKATINYNPIFESQLLTYLRLNNMKLGYVINFGEARLKDGIHRVVNNL